MFRILSYLALVASVTSQCTLCPDGSTPPLPADAVLASTCQQVIALLPSMSADGCTQFQQGTYPTLCGCFAETSYKCNVCSDGSPPNPYGDANIATCNNIEFAALFSTTEQECTANLADFASHVDIQSVCGCPGTTVPCSICPDGNSVGNPSKAIGVYNTCGGYDTFLRTFAIDSAECAGKQDSGLPSLCECPGISTGEQCSICNGGAARGETRVPDITDYCLNADSVAAFWPIASCDNNTNSYDQWACGCPSAAPDCTLCEDGGYFDLSKSSNFTKVDGTCALDQFALDNIAQLDCPAAQAIAGRDCGCNPATTDYCHICGAGNSLSDPNIYVPSFGHSCGFIEYFATAQANSGAKQCTFYQGEYRGVCCDGEPDPYPPRPSPPITPIQVTPAPIVQVAPAPLIPAPITPAPVIPAPITPAPVTPAPVIPAPITPAPVIPAPVTPAPGTPAPGTPAPVTPAPVTPAPVTPAPVTPAPVTPAPVTPAPVTPAPVTPAPVSPAPVTPAPVSPAPVTPAPVTPAPITRAPVTKAPVTRAPVTEAPVTKAPVTRAPVTRAPVTQAPVTHQPHTRSPVTHAPVQIKTSSPTNQTVGTSSSGCIVCLNGGRPSNFSVFISDAGDGFLCGDIYIYAVFVPPDSMQCIAVHLPENQAKCGCP